MKKEEAPLEFEDPDNEDGEVSFFLVLSLLKNFFFKGRKITTTESDKIEH